MTKGRSNKLVGQTGEYLVAAELSRRGLIATTFTGNVPHYDIIASDESGRHVSVQVKASRHPSWQFGDITRYFRVSFRGKRQIVGAPENCPIRRLVVVFVLLDPEGDDQYFILEWRTLRDLLARGHKAYLARHRGRRPKRWNSMHAAIGRKELERHRDKWSVVERNLR